MAKKDLPEDLQRLYFPSATSPVLVEVPSMQYLMVDGAGAPGRSAEFQEAIEALYGVGYAIKFGSKDPEVRQAPVMPLEGRFWARAHGRLPPARGKDWRWTLMLREPDSVRTADVRAASDRLRAKKKRVAALAKVRLERWKEGIATELLYVGPYSRETAAIAALRRFARKNGYRPTGRHHEIYLSNPRRTRPERLKTVLRQPLVAAR